MACDIDEKVRMAYEANYGIMPLGDISHIKNSDVPNHDFLFAGFPCQPFSILGMQKGFKDERGILFFEILKFLKTQKPRFALLENVKQLATHNDGKTIKEITSALEKIGYIPIVAILNALDYGLPQKRERTLIACFKNKRDAQKAQFPPHPSTRKYSLNNILETKVDSKHYASDYIVKKRKSTHQSKYYPSIWHENKGGNIGSHPYACALRAGASYNYLLVNGERRLTPREMLRLQGYPDSFKIVCNDSATRRQAGNSVPVPMIEAAIGGMLNEETTP